MGMEDYGDYGGYGGCGGNGGGDWPEVGAFAENECKPLGMLGRSKPLRPLFSDTLGTKQADKFNFKVLAPDEINDVDQGKVNDVDQPKVSEHGWVKVVAKPQKPKLTRKGNKKAKEEKMTEDEEP